MTSSNTGRGDGRVGVGPDYEAIRAEAAKLAPLFHVGTVQENATVIDA